MTLSEFAERIRENIDIFETDYLTKRSGHPHPDHAYPLTMSPEQWIAQLDIWLRMLEALNGTTDSPLYQETEIEDGGVEFTLEGLDGD